MCKGGGSTNTTTTSQQPFPEAVNAYTNANNWANYAANLGATTYGGNIVATNPMLPAAAAGTLNLAPSWTPYATQAAGYLQDVPLYVRNAAAFGLQAQADANAYGQAAAAAAPVWANYAANVAATAPGIAATFGDAATTAAGTGTNIAANAANWGNAAAGAAGGIAGQYGNLAAGYGQTGLDIAGNYGVAANTAAGTAPGIAAGYGNQALGYAGTGQNAAAGYGNQAAGYGGIAPAVADRYGNLGVGYGGAAPGIAATYGNQGLGYAGAGMGAARGYGNQATVAAGSAPGLIGSYFSPYTQQVVDATQAQFNNQNAIQNAGVVGNAAAQNAWGGDRSAVAQAITAGQQQTAQAPVIAGLYQQGYQQAVQAAQQQAQLQAQTGVQAGQLGIAGAGLGTQAAQAAGQLGVAGAGTAAQAAQQAGQLGIAGAGTAAQAAQGAGQLGVAGGQLGATTALGAGQQGLSAAQLQALTGIQAGQLGLAGAQAGTQAAQTAGQLGLGATQQQINAALQGGQLGVGAAQNQAQTALQAGQLGIAGTGQAAQTALGAGQQVTAANLGAGQLTNQANLGAGQLNLGAGELGTAAAAGMGNLGLQNYNVNLGSLNAQIAAGGLEQQQQQAQLNVPYQQWLSAQAYPYQTAQFLANIAEGTGGLSGGTSSTTSPAASPISQIAGLGIGGAGLIGATGGFGQNGWLSNLFGGGASLPSSSALLASPDFGFLARGGAVPHRQMGGIIPGGGPVPGQPGGGAFPGGPGGLAFPGEPGSIGTGVPNVAMSGMIPLGGGTGHPNPMFNQLASTGQTSTTTGGGSGGSQAVSDIGTAASLARLGLAIFALNRGGAIPHRQFGGSAPSMGISPNFMPGYPPGYSPNTSFNSPRISPPDVSVSIFPQQQQQQRMMGSGPPRPPAAPPGTASQGITPASAISMLSGLKSIRDLSKDGGIFGSPSDTMARGGGIVGYDEGGDVLDVHDVAGGSRGWADVAGDPGSPSGPAQFPSYQWYERATPARPQVANAYADGYDHGYHELVESPSPAAAPRDPEVTLRDDVAKDMGIAPSATIPSTMPSPSDYAGQPYRPDPWLALASAGFAMAGGRSPQAMQNIGAGALEGMKFYEQERQAAPRLNLEQAQIGLIPSSIRLREAEAERAGAEAGVSRAYLNYLRGLQQYDQAHPLTEQLLGNIPGAAAAHKEENAPGGGPAMQLISDVAASTGVPKELALATGDIESGLGANTANTKSPSNTGVFQMAKADEPGGMNDTLQNQVGLGVQKLASERADLGRRLGRDPTNAESYLAHNQGAAGAAALLAHPDMPAGEAVSLAGGAPINISNNFGGDPKAPASAFVNKVTQAYSNYEARYTGAPRGTQIAQAGPAGSFTDAGSMAGTIPFDPNFGSRETYDRFQQQYRQIEQNIRNYQAGMVGIARMPLDPRNPMQRQQMLQQQQANIQQQQANLIHLQETDPFAKGRFETGLETARTGAQPQEYLRSDFSTGVAPRSQVIAGTAPGSLTLPGAGTAPATPDGKYDPTPESLVSAPPGTVKLADQDKEKLQADQKELAEYRAATETTPQTIQRTQELGQILQTLKTGRILDAGHDLMAWARAAGYESLIPAGYDPSKAEMVNKLSTALVFEQLKAIGGRPMVAEISGLQQANANKALTVAANLDIIGNVEGGARYVQDRYQQAQAVWNKYHQLGDFDAQYLKNSPLGKIFADTKKQFQTGDTPGSRILGKYPDAQLAPDGKYYVQRGGKYLPVNLPE